jgi:hypothetical protein
VISDLDSNDCVRPCGECYQCKSVIQPQASDSSGVYAHSKPQQEPQCADAVQRPCFTGTGLRGLVPSDMVVNKGDGMARSNVSIRGARVVRSWEMIGAGCPSIAGPGARREDSREMVRCVSGVS